MCCLRIFHRNFSKSLLVAKQRRERSKGAKNSKDPPGLPFPSDGSIKNLKGKPVECYSFLGKYLEGRFTTLSSGLICEIYQNTTSNLSGLFLWPGIMNHHLVVLYIIILYMNDDNSFPVKFLLVIISSPPARYWI